jgi:predicted HicB family RNase H-like nuclease
MSKIFPVELDDSLHRKLKHAAIDQGVSLHGLIIKVLVSYVVSELDRNDKEQKK